MLGELDTNALVKVDKFTNTTYRTSLSAEHN